MKITSNIEAIIARMERIRQQAITVDYSAALTVGVNAAMGAMKYRIFNEGLDVDRISFGQYSGKQSKITSRKFTSTREDIFDSETKRLLSKKKKRLSTNTQDLDPEGAFTEYEKERLAAGRQIRYKDLEFHGSLRRSIVVASESSTKVNCVIINDQEMKIAGYQEIQIGKIRGTEKVVIFTANNDEIATMKENTNEALNQLYDRLFNA